MAVAPAAVGTTVFRTRPSALSTTRMVSDPASGDVAVKAMVSRWPSALGLTHGSGSAAGVTVPTSGATVSTVSLPTPELDALPQPSTASTLTGYAPSAA